MAIDLDKESRPIPRKRALELASQMLEEQGDYPPRFAYDLGVVVKGEPISDELVELREVHFKRLGKKPPPQEVFE